MNSVLTKKNKIVFVLLGLGLLSGCMKIQKKENKDSSAPVIASAPAEPESASLGATSVEPQVEVKKSPSIQKRTAVFQYHYELAKSEKTTDQADNILDRVQFEFPLNTPQQLMEMVQQQSKLQVLAKTILVLKLLKQTEQQMQKNQQLL